MDEECFSVMYDILTYLMDHPEAQDTLEGIRGWWILERCIDRGSARVPEALAELERRGLVIEQRRPDGSASYRLHRERLPEIEELLARHRWDAGRSGRTGHTANGKRGHRP